MSKLKGELNHKLKDQTGSTIVIALIFVMVITLACLSLFTAMSTAVNNAGQGKDRDQAKILAASLSRIIQDEITNGVTIYEASADNPGVGQYVFKDSDSIGKYIKKTLGTADWIYYNEMDSSGGHSDLNDSRVTKTFDMSQLIDRTELSQEKFKLTVSMHWTSSQEAENSGNYNNRALYVTVTAEVQGRSRVQTCNMTSRFDYELRDAELLNPEGEEGTEGGAEGGETQRQQYYWWNYTGEME